MIKKTREEKTREEAIIEHMLPYYKGRELNNTDLKILDKLVTAKFEILEFHKTMKDMEQVGKTQRLINDLDLIIHIWKKADGAI